MQVHPCRISDHFRAGGAPVTLHQGGKYLAGKLQQRNHPRCGVASSQWRLESCRLWAPVWWALQVYVWGLGVKESSLRRVNFMVACRGGTLMILDVRDPRAVGEPSLCYDLGCIFRHNLERCSGPSCRRRNAILEYRSSYSSRRSFGWGAWNPSGLC